MERKISSEGRTSRIRPQLFPDIDLKPWLEEQAQTHGLRWLLANLDNGIIWGEWREGRLHLSSEAFGRSELRLDPAILQQARLFSEQGELRIWQGATGLQAQLCCDGVGTESAWIDEEYLLWGTAVGASANGFTELIEGAQGISHSPPLSVAPTAKRRAKLRVRHYLHEDGDGVVRISDSRLVELIAPGAA